MKQTTHAPLVGHEWLSQQYGISCPCQAKQSKDRDFQKEQRIGNRSETNQW
jgi:hypothetical protein